jgi:hypothetical protein
LRRINSQAGASEFLFSCVVCFLACFETLIRYFNKLGYIQVQFSPFFCAEIMGLLSHMWLLMDG